ncbi:MAG: FG-GAP-like repeat-containing protein [Carboxylicivirga sp.]|jgi:RHS repeat-associated protein|nr:FG-GAP-like repeat-containing protein [Carboxylicivirga sp.]
MKKILSIVCLLVMGFVLIKGQEPETHYELQSPINESKTFVARDYIKLMPGFTFKPTSGEVFKATINKLLMLPPEESLVGGSNGVTGTSKFVGSIEGSLNVETTGASSYTIPIKVVPGTAGMTPNLSIVYNSQSGNGLLGKGFLLHGLSSITRIPRNYHKDDELTSIDFVNDRFALDGNRLIAIKGAYGANGTEYRTESNNFSKVISYGNAGNGPQKFIVYTKSGLIKEYGYTDDSRIEAQRKSDVFSWQLNKVRDTKGNYFTISYYENNIRGEFRPTKIDYTGNANAGLETYASLVFKYTGSGNGVGNKRHDKQVKYINGTRQSINERIVAIESYYGPTKVWDYQIKYKSADDSKITSIQLFNKNGEHYNPTIFRYENKSDYKAYKRVYRYTTSTSASLKSTITTRRGSGFNESNFLTYNSKIYSGDFNGDGISDVVTIADTEKDASWNGLQLFLGKKDGSGLENHQFVSEQETEKYNINKVYVGDFNGDGLSDLLLDTRVSRRVRVGSRWKIRKYVVHRLLINRNLTFELVYSNEKGVQTYRDNNISIGDVNGDGLSDIIHVYTSRYGDEYNNVTFDINTGNNDFETTSSINYNYSDDVKYDNGDFNGDGCIDVFIRNADGCEIVSYNRKIESLEKIYSNTFPTQNDRIVIGDFNGDRISDFVNLSDDHPRLTTQWSIYLNTGKSFISKRTNLSYGKGNGFIHDNREEYENVGIWGLNVTASDYNSDGLVDLMFILNSKYGTSGDIVICYGNHAKGLLMGEMVDTRQDTEIKYVLGDFNGNGINDILYVDSKAPYWDGYNLKYISRITPELITSITDGYGKKIDITYEPITNDNIYTKSTKNYQYPLINIQAPYFVVANIKTENGHGEYRNTNYSYKGLKAQVLGGGILGFDEFTITDVEKNNVSTTTYDFDRTNLIPYSTGSITKVNGKLISQTTITNEVHKDANDILFHYVSENTQKEWDFNGSLKSDVKTTYTYDKTYGNILTMKVVQGASSNYFTTTTTNTYTNNVSKWHLGRLTYATIDKKLSGKAKVTNTSEFDYDASSGLLISEIIQPGNAKYALTKTYKHDAFGNIKESKVSGQGIEATTSQSTYDTKGRFIEFSTDAVGNVTKKKYNAHDGSIAEVIDANGLSVKNTYDGFGQLTKKVNADGSTVTYTRRWVNSESNAPTGKGRKAFYSDYTEATGKPGVTTYYDKFGRTLRTVTKGFGNKTILADTWYNVDGTVKQVSAPYYAGANYTVTSYEYDELERLVKETLPDGKFTTTKYEGLVTTMTDAMGYKTKREVDALGKLIKSTDANNKSVSYEYNSQSLCVKIIDPKGNTIETHFDIMGNRTKLIDPDLGTTEYDYNCLGQLTSQKDALGNTSTFLYDKLGRLISRTEKEGTTKWTYATEKPKIGLLTKETGPNNISIEYSYDTYGRLLAQKETLNTEVLTTSFAYDKYGRVTKTTYPSGFYTRNHYNEQGMLIKVSDSKNKTHWTLKDLTATGQVKAFGLGNGLNTSIEYDPLRRWMNNYMIKRGNTTINGMEYKYNAVANLVNRKTYALPSRPLVEESFDYDNLHRLTESALGSEVVTVEYDEIGNITYKSDVGTYDYGSNGNIPHAVKRITNHVGRTSLDEMDIVYSSFHKVISMEEGDNKMEITYGPGHQRKIAKYYNGSGAPMERYYAGGLFEREKHNGNTKDIHYIMTGSGCVAIYTTETNEADKLTYLHKDHLGSIAAISNMVGDIIEEFSYDPWGKRRNPQTWTAWDAGVVVGEKRGFTGHEHLDMFALINMNGRIYDPVLGRFLSADPFVQMPDHTQGLNRYTYCLNNPLNMTDPSGYSWLSNNWKSIAAAVVGVVVTVATAGAGAPVMAAGFAGGFAAGASGAALNGGNFGEVLKSGVIGGLVGFFSAGAAQGIGIAFDGANFVGKELVRAAAHGSVGGLSSMAQGGKFEHGFFAGSFSSYAGSGMQAMGIESKGGLIIASTIVGGTASALGGGKFANGAVTGAFTMWFNHLQHPEKKPTVKANSRRSYKTARTTPWEEYGMSKEEYDALPAFWKEHVIETTNTIWKFDNSDYVVQKRFELDLALQAIEMEYFHQQLLRQRIDKSLYLGYKIADIGLGIFLIFRGGNIPNDMYFQPGANNYQQTIPYEDILY